MLEVKDLVKKYGGTVAINGVSFKVGSGEIVGLLGLNGAGKSTTMNCITGYIAPTEGTVTVGGYDILKEPDKVKSIVGYLPEVFSFYSDMKVGEYLDYVCDLKGFSGNRSVRRQHIETVCEKTGISEMTGRMIRNLSKGYKQRVGFAQALIGNPEVLILDEPTVGLDPSQIIGIRQLIKDMGRERTVVVSSHILSEIQAVCSRIIVIHEGHVAADGSPAQLVSAISDQNILNIRAKGSRKDIEAVLTGVACLKSFEPEISDEDGTFDYSLAGDGTSDTREAVFQAFALSGIPLLSLECPEASMENMFLRLTRRGDSPDGTGGSLVSGPGIYEKGDE